MLNPFDQWTCLRAFFCTLLSDPDHSNLTLIIISNIIHFLLTANISVISIICSLQYVFRWLIMIILIKWSNSYMWDLNRNYQSCVQNGQRVTVIKVYSTFPKASELKLLHQIDFSVIPRKPVIKLVGVGLIFMQKGSRCVLEPQQTG